METEVREIISILRAKTQEAIKRNTLLLEEEEKLNNEKRINLIKFEAKTFFNEKVTEEKLILFAEDGQKVYPLLFITKESPEDYFWKRDVEDKLSEFGKFIFAEITTNGFKSEIIEIGKEKAKHLSVLDKEVVFKKGIYLALTWCE